MYLKLDHPPTTLDDYRPYMEPEQAQELESIAADLKGLRVAHVNATAIGGGVAEILQSLVPLFNSLGIRTERIVIDPSEAEFFQVTKKIHNLLQGADGALSDRELEIYFGNLRQVSGAMLQDELTADVWFMHDPQLLPLAGMLQQARNGDPEAWLWICHIDLTRPNQSALDALLPLLQDYHHLIFSLQQYVPQGHVGDKPVYIAPPAIDPLSSKNNPMDEQKAWDILSGMGIDRQRPLVTQVSRFDLWKDPWGVIDAFRLARETMPEIQLALLGLSQAADDPEAGEILDSVVSHAAADSDIHLFYDPTAMTVDNEAAVNAFQMASSVLVQKSIREGFGLTVTESMWKGKPVIGGNTGGIRIQIDDGANGYLVSSPEECARRIVTLLQDKELASYIGAAGRASVRRRFLLPRLALDYLKVAKAHVG